MQSKLPFVVAINKCDKGTADPQRVKTELMNHGVIVEEFGGNVLVLFLFALSNLFRL